MKKAGTPTPSQSYKPFSRFVLRTPLFPLDALAAPDTLLRTPQMQEALYVASPDLYECQQDADEATRISLRKYLHRSTTRCTPFGLFAGCTIGTAGEDTQARFAEMDRHRKTARLDTECLCKLVGYLERLRGVAEHLTYYPNDTIYRIGKQVRYLEIRKGKYRNETTVGSVQSSPYLTKALKYAEGGATAMQIARHIADDEVSLQEAAGYVGELIGSQLLRSELQPHAVGIDNLTALLGKLARLPHHPVFDDIAEIQRVLDRINRSPIGSSVDDYRLIGSIMDRIGVRYDRKHLVQVDLHNKAEHLQFDSRLVDDLTDAVNTLMEMGGVLPSLSSFAKRFVERFGGKPTPLAVVLDSETGIGYPEPAAPADPNELLDDLAMPYRYRQQGNGGGSYSRIDIALLEKYIAARAKGENRVMIDDMITSNVPQRRLSEYGPITFSVMCNLLHDENGREQLYLHGIGGSCAANLLGRFAHIDGQFGDFVQEIADYEADFEKDKLFIEIAHLPDARLGNVVMRPAIRSHVFNYLSNGNGEQRGIPLSDIMVTMHKGRVALFSKRYKKQLIPRLSCAHAYHNSRIPVYRLLCDMQVQDHIWSRSWGGIFSQLSYRPRLQYKNIILARQRWMVDSAEFSGCDTMTDDQLRDFGAALMARHGMVRHVVFAQSDNEMYIDLLDPTSIKILLSLTKGMGAFPLEEFIFASESHPIADGSGSYANEIIFCFKKTKQDE